MSLVQQRIAGPAGLLALALAGCWSSDVALMPASAMDDAPLAANYRSNMGDTIAIRRTGRGRYAMRKTTSKGKVEESALGFDRLGPTSFLAQDDRIDSRGALYSQVVFRQDGRVEQFNFACDEVVLRIPGVTKSEGGFCRFANYQVLIDAARQRSIEAAERTERPGSACDPDFENCPPLRARRAPSETYHPTASGLRRQEIAT